MVLGVAERELGMTFAHSLQDSGVERALVVCGAEGLDEISCAGDTYVWDLKEGEITETKINPKMFGLKAHLLAEVAGSTPEENSKTFRELLRSGEDIPERLTSVLDFVLMNASALLVVAGVAKDYLEGTKLARESIVSGKAWEALETFRKEGERVADEAFPNRDRSLPVKNPF